MSATVTSTVTARERRERTARRAILACLAAIIALFVLDALLFRTRLYVRILQPDSSTGLFELILRRERHTQANRGDNLVVTLGDSRFAYAPRLCNQIADKTGYVFGMAGIAGSDARVWYYMLRALDPTARRYRAVIIGVSNYPDVDEYNDPSEDPRALHYIIEQLRWGDVWDFARSFQSRELQWEAFRGGALKGLVLQADIHELLSSPSKRWAQVKLERGGFDEWTYGYEETTRSLSGLHIDWSKPEPAVALPPGIDGAQRRSIEEQTQPVAPQTGRVAQFRREWFGRIVDRYRNSRTRVIFIRLPRGPFPRPENFLPRTSSAIRELAARPGVLMVDEHAFDSLERPEFFWDALHLNRAGIARFSPMLAEEISRMLARPR